MVTGTWLDYDFPYIGNVIIPTTNSMIFQRVGQPPTSDSTDILSQARPYLEVQFQRKRIDFTIVTWGPISQAMGVYIAVVLPSTAPPSMYMPKKRQK